MTNAQLIVAISNDAGVATNLARDLIKKSLLTGKESFDEADIKTLRSIHQRLQQAASAGVELCTRIPVANAPAGAYEHE